jgi:hypothetical protein
VSYPVGSRPTVSFQFNDETGAFVDPGDVTVQLERPDGHLTTLTYSGNQVTKDDVGRYHIDFDSTGYPGLWVARAYTPVGSGQAATPDQYIRIVGTGVADGTARTEPYLSVSELREHANTALSDAAIQRLLDANTVAIDTRLGPPGERTERHDGGGSYLPLDRPLGSVTEVKEVIWSTTTTLAENDWLERGDRYLQRLATGSHPASLWRGRVEVTYTPLDDTAERIRLLVALTKLDLAYSGLASQSIGDYSETQQGDYQAAREDVFGSYSGTVLFA